MPKESKPRAGSLQFWPRKRAKKILPRVNWKPLEEKYKNFIGPLGIIGYKVGMESVIVKDNYDKSLTYNQEIFLPVTIIELPPQRILSVRFYKDNKCIGEVINNLAFKDYKWLKRKVKASKKEKSKEEIIKEIEEKAKEADKIRIIVYTKPKLIKLKKTPDIVEIALGGNIDQQIEWIKNNLDKDIDPKTIFNSIKLVDVRGVTKGKGTSGPIKRFGIKRKQHKSEKGVRRPGSLGPWNPSKVSFRVPMAGQLGYFTRVEYNKYIVDFGNSKEKNINKKGGFLHYGFIDGDFIMLKGSVIGPSKRPLFITFPLRESKKALKQDYSLIKLNYDIQK
ncbi:MAG: 50S ribosomal protein L3 [Candidatus Pacearchaeota archaeon]